MKKILLISLASITLVAIAPGGEAMVTAQESQVTESQEKTTSISIEGLAEHYHTGDEIELVASIE